MFSAVGKDPVSLKFFVEKLEILNTCQILSG